MNEIIITSLAIFTLTVVGIGSILCIQYINSDQNQTYYRIELITTDNEWKKIEFYPGSEAEVVKTAIERTKELNQDARKENHPWMVADISKI